ncbi:MAG: hypothetical protein Q4D50_04590 [Eubacteriales bacterium]|nr:hypothetical protein [Eubacteriales bacterium]
MAKKEENSTSQMPGGAQNIEKASQSFAAAAAKENRIIFRQGVYLAKNTLRPASVRVVRQRRTRSARRGVHLFVEKPRRGFSTARAPPECREAP